MDSKDKLSPDSDKAKEDALLDEAMSIIAGYEEGLSARDFKSMSDCNCQSHDDHKMVTSDHKTVTNNHKHKK